MQLFNIPAVTGNEMEYIRQVIEKRKLSGNGSFSKKCTNFFEEKMTVKKALLTTSCTHSLEMAAMLAGIEPGDEVIMPSYTFTSTANAFVLRGAKIVFVDIRKDTMNIDETLIEAAITKKTKAIVPVHYAGVACEMDKIMEIAKNYSLLVIEDAAQGVMSKYKGRYLGTIGDLGCFSFHETKNYTCGEGGALLINNDKFIERAEIIWEKGTDRQKFFRGEIDKYTWVDVGSSYLLSEINAAYLWAQLEVADDINSNRLDLWNEYYKMLEPFGREWGIELPYVPEHCSHNAHMFFLKTESGSVRDELIRKMTESDIMAIFHYVPLHNSVAGIKYGKTNGELKNTVELSERVIRLPLYYNMEKEVVSNSFNAIKKFYQERKV